MKWKMIFFVGLLPFPVRAQVSLKQIVPQDANDTLYSAAADQWISRLNFKYLLQFQESSWGIAVLLFLVVLSIVFLAWTLSLRRAVKTRTKSLEMEVQERRQAEEALRIKKEQYRVVVESSSDYIMRYDRDFRHIYANRKALEVTGLPPEQYIGRTHREMGFPEHLSELWEQNIQKVFDTGKPSKVEFEVDLAEGMMQLDLTFNPEFSLDGRVNSVIGISRDITDRKKAEEALRASEARWQTIINTSPDGISIASMDGVLQFVSDKLLTVHGYERPEDMVGKNMFEFLDESYHEQAALQLQQMMDGHYTGVKEFKLIRKNGERFYMDVNAEVLRDDSGRPVSIFFVERDVTERKHAEEVLRESEEKFRELANLLPQIIFESDVQGNLTYVNRQAYKIFGYAEDEAMIGVSTLNFYTPESRIKAIENIKRRVSGQALGSNEYTMVRKDGSTFQALVYSNPILKENKPIGLRGIIVDITERRQAEEALRLSEEWHRTILETAMDGFWMTDPQGKLLEVNQAYCRMSGYDKSELLMMNISGLEFIETVNETAAHMTNIMTRGEDRFESRHRRKDGGFFDVEISVQYSTREGGRCVAFIQDITERKQAEAALRESESRFRSYFELPLAGRAISSPEKGWIEVNDALCSMLGYTKAELIQTTWEELTHPDDLAANRAQFKRVMAGEINGYTLEKRFLKKDGQIIHANMAVHCVRNPDRTVAYFVVLIQDITERKQTEEALRKSEEQFRSVIEQAPVGMVIIRNSDGTILFQNECFTQQFGYTMADIPNIKDWWQKAYPDEDYRRAVMQEWNAAMATAIREGADIGRKQLNIICKNGVARIAEITGIVIGENFLATFTDITERKQAEEALRENQELFSLYLLHSPIYTYIKEVTPTESRVVQASENFYKMVGISNQEMLGKNMTELFPPDFAAKISADDWDVVSRGDVLKLDENLNGRNYITIKFPISLAGKKMLAGYTIDITERVQAEEVAHRMAERWAILYRAGEEISASLDSEQVFQAVYRAVRQVMPCEDFLICLYDEAHNLMGGEFILENGDRMESEPYLADRGLGGHIVHTGQAVRLNSPEEISASSIKFMPYGSGVITSSVLAVPMQLKGKMFGMISAQSYHSGVYTAEDQEWLGILAGHAVTAIENASLFKQAQEEIAERKLSEEALGESEQKYRRIVETSIEGIISLNKDTRITFINQQMASMLGYTIEEMLGQKFETFLPEDQLSDHRMQLELRAQGKSSVYERCLLSKNGHRHWVLISGKAIFNIEGVPDGSFGMVTDITDRKQAEENIQRLNAELEKRVEERTRELGEAQEQLVRHEKLAVLGQMASSVGHELRNPLAVINSAIYYLKLVQPDADAKIKQYLGIIDQEVRNSDKIITDLLDFARIKSVDREIISVSSLVNQTLQRFPVPPSIEIALDIPSDLPRVFVDPRQIIQVLGNLTVNACQAMAPSDMPNGGQLSLCSRVQNDMINIVVKDTGVGISAENMKKLFEPLFTTKTKGIGLGLAVSQKLIEANGGRIEVESEAGVGSSFSVYLPIYKESK
jgi:PAS domain S-box-containing protein